MQFLMKRRKEQEVTDGRGALESTTRFHSGPPEISPDEIECLGPLGDGSFGTVYRGRCRSLDVAVKVLHRQDLDPHSLNAFRKEVEILSKIFHPNILLYMGACTVPGKMMIVTELMPRGDLEALLHDKRIRLSLSTRMKMARDAAKGMTWLHGSNPVFIHRDLKTSNLLVTEDYSIKLCDFGLSQIKKRGEKLLDGAEGAKGTPLWMAPEVMAGDQFNEKADIYSFGIVLWEILTREEPFQEFENYEEFREAVCTQHVRPPIPPDCHPVLAQLIEACWSPIPDRRPTFPEVLVQLENIIVDTAVQDVSGRKMWKQHFLKQDRIPWTEFIRTFSNYLPAEDDPENKVLNVRCLHALLVQPSADGGDSTVTLESFGNFLNFFGPMTPSTMEPPLMDKVRNLLRKMWFHGDVGTREAEGLLAGKNVGTFLVRFSTSSPGCFTISKVARDGSINHQRIIHSPSQQGYFINGQGYADLEELLAQQANHLGLVSACLGSRFTSLFVQQQVSGYVS